MTLTPAVGGPTTGDLFADAGRPRNAKRPREAWVRAAEFAILIPRPRRAGRLAKGKIRCWYAAAN
jgi:hypothetical protein